MQWSAGVIKGTDVHVIAIDIGVFAHNEAGRIMPMLHGLLRQTLFSDPGFSVRLHVLANGCTDATAAEARKAVADHPGGADAIIHDIAQGGKSRTWNRYVHDLARPEAQVLAFLDADITIPDPAMLAGLCRFLCASPDLSGVSSRPVKDIVHDPSLQNGAMDKLIAAAGGTLNNWKTSICGQLYMLRSDVAHGFHMPIGLAGEDGFARAMVQTVNFTREGGPETYLGGQDALFHVYASERGVAALIRHQTRLVIGSAINAVIYAHLRSLPDAARMRSLADAADDPDWLPQLLKTALPRWPYGYVPVHFLTKRVVYWWRSPGRFRPRRMAVTAAGFVFDAVAYGVAQYKMWRGAGAGYW